jgi:hypothetical protein
MLRIHRRAQSAWEGTHYNPGNRSKERDTKPYSNRYESGKQEFLYSERVSPLIIANKPIRHRICRSWASSRVF